LTVSQEIKNLWGQINAMFELTAGLLDVGSYQEALNIAQQALEGARELEGYSPRANSMLLRCLLQLGDTYRALQAFSKARQVDLEALRCNESDASRSAAVLVFAALCADCVMSKEWEEAYYYAQQALFAEADSVLSCTRIPHWCVIEALLHGGSAGAPQEYMERLGKHSGDGLRDRIEYLRAHAVLARWEGHLEQEVTTLEQVRTLTEEIGLLGELWQIQADLGALYQARGEQGLADRAWAEADRVVQLLARNIEDEALRASLLAALAVNHFAALPHGRIGSPRWLRNEL
jgi:tetratricopeptide (TPR) repeat protein